MHSIRLLAMCSMAFLTIATASAQQGYPTRPVTLVVQFPPGGGTDNIARLLVPGLSAALGQPVIVDNRPGAGGNIGTEAVARAAPDGYTLLMGNVSPLVINPHTYAKMAVDPMKDLVAVGLATQGPLVFVVNPELPAKTLAEFIAYARKNPGKLNYASSGTGGITHIATELLAMKTGIDLVHVPYKGSAQALQDLITGQVQAMSDGLGVVLPMIRAGRIRPLLITSTQRSEVAPDIPVGLEAGVQGYAFYGWLGVFAPAATPPEVLRKIKSALDTTLAEPKVRERILANGSEIGGKQSSAEFARQVAEDYERWGEVVKRAGIKAD